MLIFLSESEYSHICDNLRDLRELVFAGLLADNS